MAYYDGELIKENFAKRLNQVDGIMITTGDALGLLSLSIYDTPTADVAEVKHGKWMEVDSDVGWTLVRCSVCEIEYSLCEGEETDELHFCPFCGAIMDE